MSEMVDFVEYGGHTIRRGLAEDVERRVQAHRDTVRIYHAMLEYARRGWVGWMDILQKSTDGETYTVGEFIQDLGLEVATTPKDEDELRRKLVEEELGFGEELNALNTLWGGLRDIDCFEGKEPRPDETLGERFRLT